MRIPARVEYPDAPVLYGFVSGSPGSTTMISGGSHVSYHAAEDIHFDTEGFVIPEDYTDAFCAGDKFYVINCPMGCNPTISTYDFNTGEILDGPTQFYDGISGTKYIHYYHGLDVANNCVYLVEEGEFDWGTFQTPRDLYRLNLDNYEFTKVGSAMNRFFRVMFIGPDGKLYGVEYNNAKLWRIGLDGAENEEIGKLTGMPGGYFYAQPGSAVTDPATGLTYLSMQSPYSESMLYSFDIAESDFALKLISKYPHTEYIQGLYIPEVEAKAPGAVTNFGYADGKLSFTVPTTTYSSKETLSGELTAHVTIDGEKQNLSVTPGQDVSVDKTLADGRHYFAVAISNAEGVGAERKYNVFIGNDVPCAVTNLTVDVQGDQAILSWTAPTESRDHGYVNDDDIRYRILRHPDLTVVASSLAETTFTDNLPDIKEHYYYTVTAMNVDRDGDSANTITFAHGYYYEVPFVEPFSLTEDFASFSVVDFNNDSKTWKWNSDSNAAVLEGNGIDDPAAGTTATRNNDYLISLPIDLAQGVHYLLEIDHTEPIYPEMFNILLGTNDEIDGRERPIAEKIEIINAGVDSLVFNVKESGKQRLILHNNTVGNSSGISINEIRVTIDGVDKAPAAVNDLKATAGFKGEIANTISFTTPTKTYDGSALSSITSISIFKGEDLKHPVYTFENPKTGESLKWNDPDAEYGWQSYTVVTYNENGQGGNTHTSNWVGLDLPLVPQNFKATMNPDNYKPQFTWDETPSIGQHGGYVDVDAVRYRLRAYGNMYYIEWGNWPPIITDIEGTSVCDEDYVNNGSQEQKAYLLEAFNDAGYTDGAYAAIVVGKPYDWPFIEMFDGGEPSSNPWILNTTTSEYHPYAWSIENTADGGILKFTYQDYTSSTQRFDSPRISIEGAATPQLSFYMKHNKDLDPGEVVLHVYASVDDGDWLEIGQVDCAAKTNGWLRHSLSIPTTGKSMQFSLSGEASDGSAAIMLDNFAIDDVVTCDLAIESFEIDKRIIRGESGEAIVKITSLGDERCETYSVNIYRGDDLIASKEGDIIVQDEIKFFLFDIPTTMLDGGKTFDYYAVIDCMGDQKTENNISESVVVSISGSVNPNVELTGTAIGNAVTLTWEAPVNEVEKTFTDGFDNYDAFLINGIGNYITYDGDGETPIYITSNPLCPNAFEKQAWMVWNPTEAGLSTEKYPQLLAHSGEQYLANWASTDGRAYTRQNDDWLISPEVLPNSDVKFYVYVPYIDGTEEYQDLEIYYIDTPLTAETFEDVFDPESFTLLDHIRLKGSSTEWVAYEYTLPSSARQFAIRGCGEPNVLRCVMFFDDLSYVPLGGEKMTLTLEGFRLYRDGELLANLDANTLSYVDTEVSPLHEYT